MRLKSKGNNTKSYIHCHTHVTSFEQFHLIGASIKTIQFPMSHPIAKTDVLTKNLYKTVSTNETLLLKCQSSELIEPYVKENKVHNLLLGMRGKCIGYVWRGIKASEKVVVWERLL